MYGNMKKTVIHQDDSGILLRRKFVQPRAERSKGLLPYPLSFSQCNSWALAADVQEPIALQRFIAYCALRCIANNQGLNSRLIVRGSCALWLRYGGQRPFGDIDFLCQGLSGATQIESDGLADEIKDVLSQDLFQYFPAGPEWESTLIDRIKIEVSPVQGTVPYRWIALGQTGLGRGASVAIRVIDLERVIAEKIVGVLTHLTRGNKRGKDVADISIILRQYRDRIDYSAIKRILVSIAPWQRVALPITRECFTEEIKRAAVATFEQAIIQTPAPQTQFESAWADVMGLVGRLEE